MASITVDGIVKTFGGQQVLRNLSLHIPDGAFYTLLGPSGCGKTTLLRCIAGFYAPDGGRLLFDQDDVTHVSAHRRDIGMVFQDYALFPDKTAFDNVAYGLRARGVARAETTRRANEALDKVGLLALADRYPAQMSGGQRQRVALARALVIRPRVLLMDEPLSNLDAQLRHEMRREIRALQQDLGITMVYVTHDQTEAMSMADQVVLLRGGQIEQHDTPDALYARPATEFAARFIGTPPMNLIGVTTLHGAMVIAGTQGPALAGAPAGAVKLGVRPEHIRIDDSGIAATVESVEYFGADSIVVCRIGDTSGVAVRVGGHLRARAGEALRLSWQDGQQHFFAADSAVINTAER